MPERTLIDVSDGGGMICGFALLHDAPARALPAVARAFTQFAADYLQVR